MVSQQAADTASSLFQQFFQRSSAPIALPGLLGSLAVGVVLSLILRWHFRRFASTLSNREQFANVFPFVLLTTLLIITIVKSSLALSLGLVGALSIVRFRTPVKEPEELAYLFVAIAMGLGLGANQPAPTVVAGGLILVVMGVLASRRQVSPTKNLYLSVDWTDGTKDPGERLEVVNSVIMQHVARSDLRRFDVRDGTVEATYFVDLQGAEQLSGLVRQLQQTQPGLAITFIDQDRIPQV